MSPPLHVDAAALAAVLAIDRGAPGIYNITEPSRAVSVEKARRELGGILASAYRIARPRHEACREGGDALDFSCPRGTTEVMTCWRVCLSRLALEKCT